MGQKGGTVLVVLEGKERHFLYYHLQMRVGESEMLIMALLVLLKSSTGRAGVVL